MSFEVTKTFIVHAPTDEVWAFLIDPNKVASCLPGAAITSKVDDKTFTGTMTVKVGPVTTSYKGKVVFQRLDADAHVAEVVAQGQDVKGKGGADMKLSSTLKELAPGETEVTAVSKVNITGLLAQMGRGMIQDVSDELFQIFSKRVQTELENEPAPAPPAEAVPVEAAPSSAAAASSLPSPASSPDPEPAPAEALDLSNIGARALQRSALRALRRPAFWIAVAVIAGLVYVLFIR